MFFMYICTKKYLELCVFKGYVNVIILYGILSTNLFFSLNILFLESKYVDVSSLLASLLHSIPLFEYVRIYPFS